MHLLVHQQATTASPLIYLAELDDRRGRLPMVRVAPLGLADLVQGAHLELISTRHAAEVSAHGPGTHSTYVLGMLCLA